MKQVSFGIVGLGMSARTFHIPLLLKNQLPISAVCTSKPDSEVAKLFPYNSGINVHSGMDGFCQDCSYDVALVLTPNHLHGQHIKQLLSARKHVVVDKPAATSLAELEELVELATANRVKLTAFHNRRWDSDFLTLQSLIRERGLQGKISYFESRFDKFRPNVLGRWREQDLPGSGLLFDIGPHLIDQALLLFGQPLALSADLRIQRHGAVATDYFQINMQYSDTVAVLRASSLAAHTPFRFYLESEYLTALCHGYDGQESALKGKPDGLLSGVQGNQQQCILYGDGLEKKLEPIPGNYSCFYLNLVQAIAGTSEILAVDCGQMLDVQKVIELSLESADKEKEWVYW